MDQFGTLSPTETVTYGISPDFSVTTSKKAIKTGVVLAAITGMLLILLAVMLLIWLFIYNPWSASNTEITVLTPSKELCEGKWTNNQCTCDNNHYGKNCELQKRSSSYLYAGVSTTSYPGMSTIYTGSNNECQRECTKSDNCIGFQASKSKCTLLAGVVGKSEDMIYAPISQNGIYVRNIEDYRFTDRVFIASHRNNIPNAYTQVYKSPGYNQLFLDQIVTVDYIPRHVSMPPGVTGIYSRHTFTEIPPPGKDVIYSTSGVDIPASWSSPITCTFTREVSE